MTASTIIKTDECLAFDSVNLPCATIKTPKMIKFPRKTNFDISFVHPGLKVHTVEEALRTVRSIVSWTTPSADKIREILRTVGTWKFPVPRRSSNIFEITYRFALQHFYRYCCISQDTKLIYDETYFNDLNDYLGENGYANGQIMCLPPALICETLLFIKEYDESIDYKPEDEQENANDPTSVNLDGSSVNISKVKPAGEISNDPKAKRAFGPNVVTTNYSEAKNIILAFIKEILTIETQINTSILQFFSKQWLSNVYRGCYQFSSQEAFCMFFNNTCIFDFSQHAIFRVPDIRGAFTQRLVIPEVNIKNVQKRKNSYVCNSIETRIRDGTNENIGDILGRICGLKLVGHNDNSKMDSLAIKKLNRIPSMAIRMCPNTDDSAVGGSGQFTTAIEILSGIKKGILRRPQDDSIIDQEVITKGRRSAKTSRLAK